MVAKFGNADIVGVDGLKPIPAEPLPLPPNEPPPENGLDESLDTLLNSCFFILAMFAIPAAVATAAAAAALNGASGVGMLN